MNKNYEKALQLHYRLLQLLNAVNDQENKEEKRIFCGTQDFVDFFENIIFAIDLDIDYEVEGVDGELEIVIKSVDNCKDCCKHCGKPITDYKQVEMADDELRQTYHCSCGYYGEQIFGLKYKRTEDIQ